MECTGRIQNIAQDWETGKFLITLAVNEKSVVNEIKLLESFDKLRITADKWKNKRSLEANAYAWVLFTKIAEAISTPEAVISKDEVYEEVLQKYGCLYKDEEGYITITIKSSVDVSNIKGHWKFYKSNGQFSSYLMIKGSSEYDTAEMARFIDGVVYEAKVLGIETLTPDELERMKAAWGSR